MNDMNDNNQQQNNQSIDDYSPPAANNAASVPPVIQDQLNKDAQAAPTPQPDPVQMPSAQDLAHGSSPVKVAEPAQPAQPAAPMPQAQSSSNKTSTSAQIDEESLEAQNIFVMLGVEEGSDEERESFLDELQSVIWEDFLEKDAELLITSEEKKGLDELKVKELPEEEKQEEIVAYLEKLIPDLEEILLEKALELKEDLFRERLKDMKEHFQGKEDTLKEITGAEELLMQGKWKTAAKRLNTAVKAAS